MTNRHYLNPADAAHPTRLPTLETFEGVAHYCDACEWSHTEESDPTRAPLSFARCADCAEPGPSIERGWFYRIGLPGCLPDSDAFGPYESEALALHEARELHGDPCPPECPECGGGPDTEPGDAPEPPAVCADCGSLGVRALGWVSVNGGESVIVREPAATYRCPDCGSHKMPVDSGDLEGGNS